MPPGFHGDTASNPLSQILKVEAPPTWTERSLPAEKQCDEGACRCNREVFENVYVGAEDDPTRVPWGDGLPSPSLVAWLNRDACQLVRPGARTVVIGCGLGEDVAELARRGFGVMGFDCSHTAARWAARRYPALSDRFLQADLFNLPPRLLARFDLAIEINTIDCVEPSLRPHAARGISRLLTHRGVALVVCRGASSDDPLCEVGGPPYAIEPAELQQLLEQAGLSVVGDVTPFFGGHQAEGPRLRGVFRRL